MARFAEKRNRAFRVAMYQYRPYTIDMLAKEAKCSRSTANSAIERLAKYYHFYWCYRSINGSLGYLHFPHTWSENEVRDWLNAHTKSGRSRTKIHRM